MGPSNPKPSLLGVDVTGDIYAKGIDELLSGRLYNVR
jgi:hypothetical protein